MNRREALSLGLMLSAAGAASVVRADATRNQTHVDPIARELDSFILRYCKEMNAPGLILGIADVNGLMRSSSYGYSDVAAKTPPSRAQLFEIGSITKSFVALLILQLHESGKVDIHSPIRRYLPWLSMETDFGEILIHHLLTHSSGMPADAPLFPRSADWRPRQAFAPGTQFHYCNWGYDVLGRLIEYVEGRAWADVLTERILTPLEMRQTVATITSQTRSRIVQSYVALHDDRPYPRHGPLVPAGNLTVVFAAGSIASTADDMGLYLQMLLNRGRTSTGPLISEESFTLFSSPHIPAPLFGSAASYGYGIVVDQLEGRTRLRHTGGAVSFASSLQADLDSGFGAFSSINADLGYRPEPITEYTLRLLHAQAHRARLPEPPTIDATGQVVNGTDYVGVFRKPDGTQIEVKEGHGRSLVLIADGVTGGLQPLGGDLFLAEHPAFALFPLVFGRDSADSAANPAPVTDLSYGADWYVNPQYHGPGPQPDSAAFERYVGTYYAENPWYDTTHIVQRQGQLYMGGDTLLVPIGDRRFRIGRDSSSPELIEFADVVEGHANTLRFWGVDMRRIADDRRR